MKDTQEVKEYLNALETSRRISDKLATLYRSTLERCIKTNSIEPAKKLFEAEDETTKNKPVSESMASLEQDIDKFLEEVNSWE